jgi:hypothetical protein
MEDNKEDKKKEDEVDDSYTVNLAFPNIEPTNIEFVPVGDGTCKIVLVYNSIVMTLKIEI